jgi:hypothetical protein
VFAFNLAIAWRRTDHRDVVRLFVESVDPPAGMLDAPQAPS